MPDFPSYDADFERRKLPLATTPEMFPPPQNRKIDALPEHTAGCFKDCSDIIDAAVDRAKNKESSRVNEGEDPPKKRQNSRL